MTVVDPLPALREINELAAFNRWAGFEVVSAGTGSAELRLPWREDFGQYAGFLHAGLVTALLWFAASRVRSPVRTPSPAGS